MRKLLAIGACISVLGTASGAAAADTTVKIACYLPPFSVTVTKILKPYMQAVEAESKGSIKFQEFWGGALGRNPEQQYKLMTDGIGDVFYMASYLSGGQFPDNTIFDLPGLIHTAEEGSVAFWRMYKAGHLRGFGETKVLGLYMTSMQGIHTRKPFKTIDDLKGMKIRATGTVMSDFMKQLGVVPVYMSNNDLPQALSNGVVDGLTNEWTGITTFKLQNLVKHHYEAPMGGVSFIIGMNMEKWKSLTAEQQAAMDKFGGEVMSRNGGVQYDQNHVTRRAPLEKDKSHVFIYPSKEEWQKVLDAHAEPVYKRWISTTPEGQRKFDAVKKILADIRAGK